MMAERLNANWACLVNCLGDEGRSAAAELLSGIVASVTALSHLVIESISTTIGSTSRTIVVCHTHPQS